MCNDAQQQQIELCLSMANEFCNLASGLNSVIFLYPYIVNEVFACELFLKAIAMKEHTDNQYKHDHNLKTLWLDIPSNVQEEIIKTLSGTSLADLTTFLDEASNAFEQWRYAFEVENITLTISSLDTFACSLQTYCNNKL